MAKPTNSRYNWNDAKNDKFYKYWADGWIFNQKYVGIYLIYQFMVIILWA